MELLQQTYWGNTVQDYLLSLSVFLVCVLAAWLLDRYLKSALLGLAGRTTTEVDDLLVKRCVTPLTLLLVAGGLWVAADRLAFSDLAEAWVGNGLAVLATLVCFFLFMRFIQVIIAAMKGVYLAGLRARSRELPPDQPAKAERVAKQATEVINMIIGVLAVMTVLSMMGVNLMAIWASLGIGGIAVVVAVKEPLSNLVGRLYIFSTGIFDTGDFVVFGKWSGTVKNIGLFRTSMELFADMTTVSIPNASFITGAVQNYAGRTKFMYKWDLDVPYGTPADKVQQLVERLRELIGAKPELNPDRSWIYLSALGPYSKKIRVWFQVNLDAWSTSLFYGNDVLHEIQLLFNDLDVPFAFPTQTVELAGDDPAVLPDAEAGTAPEPKP